MMDDWRKAGNYRKAGGKESVVAAEQLRDRLRRQRAAPTSSNQPRVRRAV